MTILKPPDEGSPAQADIDVMLSIAKAMLRHHDADEFTIGAMDQDGCQFEVTIRHVCGSTHGDEDGGPPHVH
jgi:hypothetical protein